VPVGFHEQAVFDTTCPHMVLSLPAQPAGGNVTSHDPKPVYDMNLMLRSLQTCLSNDQYCFWAKLADEHQIKVVVTSVDDLRTEFIRHIYGGDCVSSGGTGWKEIVTAERWSQSMVSVSLIAHCSRWNRVSYLFKTSRRCVKPSALNRLQHARRDR